MFDVIPCKKFSVDQLGIDYSDVSIIVKQLFLKPLAVIPLIDFIVFQIELVAILRVAIVSIHTAHYELNLCADAFFVHLVTHLWLNPIIAINKHDPLTGCRFKSSISCGRKSTIILMDHLNSIILSRIIITDCTAIIWRTIIHEEDLNVLQVLILTALYALS